jgi:hypothetical protein
LKIIPNNASYTCNIINAKQRLHLDQLKVLAKTQIPFIERGGEGGLPSKLGTFITNNFNYL